MRARECAIVTGIVLILFGLLGFLNNPLIFGLFATNNANNIIHIVLGAILLVGAFSTLGSTAALKLVGAVYAIVAVLGFFMVGNDLLLGFIAVNTADQWLHVALAVIILLAGFLAPDEDRGMEM